MYIPRPYSVGEQSEMLNFIHQHPLATMVTTHDGVLQANHIPMMVADKSAETIVLQGHVARANPLWQSHDLSKEVLLVFQGADGYISPNWYPSKALHGKDVPTWNYLAVHARGQLIIRDDTAWLHPFLERLTAQHESRFQSPWKVSDAPPDYLDKMLKAIVGIEIRVTQLIGKYKMSQNRKAEDIDGAINGLSHQDSEQEKRLLAEMRRVNQREMES